jgi:hypothetical protein
MQNRTGPASSDQKGVTAKTAVTSRLNEELHFNLRALTNWHLIEKKQWQLKFGRSLSFVVVMAQEEEVNTRVRLNECKR